MTPALPSNGDEAALFHLHASDPILSAIITRVGPRTVEPPERRDLFHALLRSIIYQQLHGSAASAIHARVAALTPKLTAAALSEIPDSSLRAAGISANKLLAIRDLAVKTLDRTVPTPKQAASLTDDELIARLTTIRGIGPWTVHMLLIFHLGRPDVLPTGDYAIRKAFSLHFRKGRPITPLSLERHARRWQPHRSLACWYLWRSLDTTTP